MSQIIHLLPMIDPAATKRAGVGAPVSHQRKRQRPIKFSDEVILDVRRMYEREGKCTKAIHEKYPYLSIDYITQIIKYQSRANLRI
jgi:hypothetical protein